MTGITTTQTLNLQTEEEPEDETLDGGVVDDDELLRDEVRARASAEEGPAEGSVEPGSEEEEVPVVEQTYVEIAAEIEEFVTETEEEDVTEIEES